MFNHDLILGNNNKLLVIFQGMLYNSSDMNLVEDTNFKVINDKVHDSYSYFRLAKKHFENYNILFIKDNNFGIVDWYYFNGNDNIIDELNSFINSIYDKLQCNDLYFFGSSKGGFASIIYGLTNENTTFAYSLCPQMNLCIPFEMYDSIFYEKIKEDIHYECRKEELSRLIPNLIKKSQNCSSLYIIASVNDKYFIDYDTQLISNEINIEFIKGTSHSRLVYSYGEYALVSLLNKINKTNKLKFIKMKVFFKYILVFFYSKIKK